MGKEIVLLKDEYWVDDNNNNKWDAKIFMEEEAIRYSQALINFNKCWNWQDCSNSKCKKGE